MKDGSQFKISSTVASGIIMQIQRFEEYFIHELSVFRIDQVSSITSSENIL